MASPLSAEPVLIAGGGLSGLAAAVHLSARSVPVLLVEQRPHLGGRAYSFTDTVTGDRVDNGQHALIAGYTRTRTFLETIGSAHLLRIQSRPRLDFHHPSRGFCHLTFPRLPVPLHLGAGVLTSPLFTWREKWALARAGLAIMGLIPPGAELLEWQTVARWLDSLRQPEGVRFSLWEPLAVSIMNETVDAASAAVFVRSLRTAFLGGWSHAAMAIPTVGLSELFAEPAQRFIEEHGGTILCGRACSGLEGANNRVHCAILEDGSRVPCRAAILALPPSAVGNALPAELRKERFLQGIDDLPVSPIVSIHLWFTRQPMEHEMLGLPGRRVQWLFRKERHLSAVISAAHKEVSWTNAELVRQAESDVRGVFGDRLGELRHSLVIREKRATFSSTPAVEARRPGTVTPWDNLFLAGDWTGTGYPATIEGAVMSGEAAALAALAK